MSATPARAEVEDTFAEAFRSIYAEILITARDRRWLDEAVRACAFARNGAGLMRQRCGQIDALIGDQPIEFWMPD